MSHAQPCEVCSETSVLEVYEIRLCQRCHDAPAEAPGAAIVVRHEKRDKLDQISVTFVHDVSIQVEAPEPLQVSVKFTHERMGHKLVKVFKEEYQAGDAQFDDAIYIADHHRASTEALLARPGARAAILTLVGEKNRVEIDHGTIRFEAHDEGATPLLSYLQAALALSRHVQAVG